jgi:hypothetical protein
MPDEDARQVRPAAAVLQEIGGGKLHTRISEQLAELTAAVIDTGKKGELTLKLTVAPIKAGNTSTLIVTGSSTVKKPAGDADSPSSVFFPDRAGNLRRDDPNQPTLPLRQVEDTRKATA